MKTIEYIKKTKDDLGITCWLDDNYGMHFRKGDIIIRLVKRIGNHYETCGVAYKVQNLYGQYLEMIGA